jgi:DNA-binding MltR family transcriptional regulator
LCLEKGIVGGNILQQNSLPATKESNKKIDNKKFNDVYALIKSSQDRSAGVIAGVLLEELLMELISASMIDGLNESFLKELYGNNGPFSSFYSKTQVAYTFGLIGEEEFVWLEVIRKIRNKCAHHLTHDTKDIDFSKSPFINYLQEMLPQRWIDNLDKANKEKILQAREDIFDPKGAREMFNYLAALTALALIARLSTAERRVRPASISDNAL